MLFQPNWWTYIGEVDETCLDQVWEGNEDDKSCCSSASESDVTWLFLGDIQETDLHLQSDLSQDVDPETIAPEEPVLEDEVGGAITPVSITSTSSVVINKPEPSTDDQDNGELVTDQSTHEGSTIPTSTAKPESSSPPTKNVRTVSFSKPLARVDADHDNASVVGASCWPNRDSIKLIRSKRNSFGWPSKSRPQLEEIDSSSTSESTYVRGSGDQEESSNNLDQADWLQSVIKLQDDRTEAVNGDEKPIGIVGGDDNYDDDEELLGEFIDYDAEPDESDWEEDDQTTLIKSKPRRRMRIAWFARMSTNYARKLVLDGYHKL